MTGMNPPVASPAARRSRHAWIWPVVLAAAISVASSRPRLADPISWENFDKVAHFLVFGLLAILVCRLRPGWRFAVLAAVLTSVYGGLDEWHQSFVPGRKAGPDDWVADTLGAIVAVICYTRWTWFRRLLEGRAKTRAGRPTPAAQQSSS